MSHSFHQTQQVGGDGHMGRDDLDPLEEEAEDGEVCVSVF